MDTPNRTEPVAGTVVVDVVGMVVEVVVVEVVDDDVEDVVEGDAVTVKVRVADTAPTIATTFAFAAGAVDGTANRAVKLPLRSVVTEATGIPPKVTVPAVKAAKLYPEAETATPIGPEVGESVSDGAGPADAGV